MLEQLPPGSFTEEDARLIMESLNRVKAIKGDCLEIGSDLGRSSTFIAGIIKDTSHLLCVDIWSNETWSEIASQLREKAASYPRRDPRAFAIFKYNIKKRGLDAVVTPIRNKSEEAVKEFKNPLKFIFIDGCHEYEYVKKDIEWVEYLVEGGEVVFHDYTDSWPGVKAAVNEFARDRSFKLVDSGGNCVCLRKIIAEQSISGSLEQPLVSVIIPTHNRAELLTTRAIPSVLNQTYQNFELIVVADRCTDDTKDRVEKMNDPRIRFVELTDRPPLPDDLRDRWRVASGAPRNRGVQMAKGEWICLLDDDDEYTPRHIEALFREAMAGHDFVYGKILILKPNGEQIIQGKYPPEGGRIGACCFIYSSKYKNIEFNTDAAITDEPCDYNFCRKVIEAGAKISFVDEIVYVHYRPTYIWEKLADCERRSATCERRLAACEKQLATKSARIASLESEIWRIQRSIPMLLADGHQRRVEKLLRRGTCRRRYYELGVTAIRVILNEGWYSFWKQFKKYITNPRNDRGQA